MDKHLLLALAIPVLFLVATGLVKSLVSRDLFWSNFYLGIDIALAALASGVVNVVDISSGLAHSAISAGSDFADRMYYNAIFLVLGFSALMVAMVIHQRWEDRKTAGDRLKRSIILGGLANLIGAFSMGMFIWLRLKGKL